MAPLELAPIFFAGVGSIVASLAVVISTAGEGPGIYAFALLLPIAFFALLPAAAAGGIFALLGAAYLKLRRQESLHFIAGCAIGAASGYIIMKGLAQVFGSKPHSDFWHFINAGVFAGGISGGTFCRLKGGKDKHAPIKLSAASLAADGTLDGIHGHCPSCNAVIKIDEKSCPRCRASFDENAVWRVAPLTTKEQDFLNRALTSRSNGLPTAPAELQR